MSTREWDLFEALADFGDAHGLQALSDVTGELLVEAVERLPGYATPGFMEYAKEKLAEI